MVIIPNRTIVCEWFVVRYGCKNAHHEDMCSKDIGLRVQNMVTTLSSIVNLGREGGMTFMTICIIVRMSTLTMNEIFI